MYTVENIPKVHLQDKIQHVYNPANILSQQAYDEMDSVLYALGQKIGTKTVVAMIPSIGDENCFEFSHQLLNRWGVGKKREDNGLAILLVTDQQRIQLCTGYGLGGDLLDTICERIQTKDVIPYLKRGDWSREMVVGVQAVCRRLDDSMINDNKDTGEKGISASAPLFTILGFIVVAGVVGKLAARTNTRCPKCGEHQLQRSGTNLVSNRSGVKTEDIIHTYHNCKYTVVRRQQSYDDNYRGRGGRGGGPLIGDFKGGSLRSGEDGFGDGGFGGGSGGGGSAGSRF